MNRLIAIVALLSTAGFVSAAGPKVKIGDKVEDLQFKDIRYLNRSLRDFGDKKAYVLVFVDSGCPIVARYLPELQRLETAYRGRGVQFVAVNAGMGDTIATMAAQAVEHGVEFPFVKDFDYRVVDAVGVERTPEVVVLDGERMLRYRGRIDDRFRTGGQIGEPTRHDLALAIDGVLAGKPVEEPMTPVEGCLITKPADNSHDKPVTFAKDVAPILAKHCQKCHQPNTAAPFSLLTYDQARTRGRTIAEVASEGRMPPWFAAAHDGDRIQHHSLSDSERDTVVQWVKTGMTRGDDSQLPKQPEAVPEKWRIGEPDLVLTTIPFDLPKEGDIAYKYVALPHIFVEETWMQGVQILPDTPKAVHHANLAYVKIGEDFKETNFITGVVPGGEPMTLDNGTAYRIPKGSVLALQIHFVPTGKPETVRLRVGLRYARGTVEKQLRHMLFVDTHYAIPPGAPAYPVKVVRTLDRDVIGIGLFAHMHVRGKAMTFTATPPDGKTEPLLTIANYNFEWQIPYRWEPGKKLLPKGTKVECVGIYDNSPFNPYNPDPNKRVLDGQQTYHEMMNGFFFFIDANEKLGLAVDPKTGHAITR